MKYWGYFIGKLIVAGAVCLGILQLIHLLIPDPKPFMRVQQDPFAHDLPYTFAMLGFWLFCCAVLYGIVWDQRLRCRTCLRRLRMPIQTGSWKNILFGPPKTEYICPFGHGTLKVPELHLTGNNPPDWQPHGDDIWKELFEETRK